MGKFRDLHGQTFAYLTVISRGPPSKHNKSATWVCECVCGNQRVVKSYNLTTGVTKSCGCKQLELRSATLYKPTHEATGTPLYRVWQYIKKCCYNPNSDKYAEYSAAGIVMDDSWLGVDGFSNFKKDVGERPEGHVLHRKDTSKAYGPDNYVWLPKEHTVILRTNAVTITHDGRVQTLGQWADELGVSKPQLYRYRRRYPNLSLCKLLLKIQEQNALEVPVKEPPPKLVPLSWKPTLQLNSN